jgi:hypothetical protein
LPFGPLPETIVEKLLTARGLDSKASKRLAALSDGSVGRALELAEDDGLPKSAGPLAAVTASDGLPKDLPAARVKVERALYSLGQDLRRRHLEGEATFARVEAPLRELARLRAALRANADPRLILTLAALEAEATR